MSLTVISTCAVISAAIKILLLRCLYKANRASRWAIIVLIATIALYVLLDIYLIGLLSSDNMVWKMKG